MVFSFQFSVFSFQQERVALLKTENRKLKTALAFRELEALARALLSVLLALLFARDESGVLERGAEVGVELHQRARDAVGHRAGLARGASARDVYDDVELARGVG